MENGLINCCLLSSPENLVSQSRPLNHQLVHMTVKNVCLVILNVFLNLFSEYTVQTRFHQPVFRCNLRHDLILGLIGTATACCKPVRINCSKKRIRKSLHRLLFIKLIIIACIFCRLLLAPISDFRRSTFFRCVKGAIRDLSLLRVFSVYWFPVAGNSQKCILLLARRKFIV